MSKTIWKYRLPRDGRTFEIREHIVKILHVGTQEGMPTLWAIVDPEINPKGRYVEVVAWGTGWPMPDDVYAETTYWGSCEDHAGYIWHYFAVIRNSEYLTDWASSGRSNLYDNRKSEYLGSTSLSTAEWDYLTTALNVCNENYATALEGVGVDYAHGSVEALESSVACGKTEKTHVYA